jgi:hypothetical protein
VACGSRAENPGIAPGATATVSTATATTAATVSPTLRPNPTAGPGVYTSVALAYRVELPAGWRRSACASSPERQKAPAAEGFTSASLDDEIATDIGANNPGVQVRVEDNAAKLTALQWIESSKATLGFGYGTTGTKSEKTSFDGKADAARVIATDGSLVHAIVVSAGGQIYAIERTGQPVGGALPAQTSLLNSLHILSDVELSDAKATLASPAPAAARTAEEVADAVSRGFAQKDVAVLATVAWWCVWQGNEQAGAAARPSSVYLSNLQKSLTGGLTVALQPRPIETPANATGSAQIRGTWKDASRAQQSARFIFRQVGNTWYWEGVVLGP